MAVHRSIILTRVADTRNRLLRQSIQHPLATYSRLLQNGRDVGFFAVLLPVYDQKQWLGEGLSQRKKYSFKTWSMCSATEGWEVRIPSILRPTRYRYWMVSLCERYDTVLLLDSFFENSYRVSTVSHGPNGPVLDCLYDMWLRDMRL